MRRSPGQDRRKRATFCSGKSETMRDTARILSELARNFPYEGMLAMLHEVREAQV